MTTPPDNNQPSTEQIPVPFHVIDGITFVQLYEQLVMLRFSDALFESVACVIAIPSPVGLQLYELADIVPADIHPPCANPDDPFEPAGQHTIMFVARARPLEDAEAEVPPESPPPEAGHRV